VTTDTAASAAARTSTSTGSTTAASAVTIPASPNLCGATRTTRGEAARRQPGPLLGRGKRDR
jgi:hypothetical protein